METTKMREWLKELRRKKGLQAQEAAKLIGISVSYYCQIESGVRDCPVHTAKKIAAVLDFDWTRFYDEV